MAYQFKIQLMNVAKPPVWRQIQVPEKITFHDLHELIQLVLDGRMAISTSSVQMVTAHIRLLRYLRKKTGRNPT